MFIVDTFIVRKRDVSHKKHKMLRSYSRSFYPCYYGVRRFYKGKKPINLWSVLNQLNYYHEHVLPLAYPLSLSIRKYRKKVKEISLLINLCDYRNMPDTFFISIEYTEYHI